MVEMRKKIIPLLLLLILLLTPVACGRYYFIQKTKKLEELKENLLDLQAKRHKLTNKILRMPTIEHIPNNEEVPIQQLEKEEDTIGLDLDSIPMFTTREALLNEF